MQRRIFLMALAAAPLLADKQPPDPSKEAFELFTKIASELSGDNPMVFLESVDHAMPHYEDFEKNLMALTGLADLTCSIETISENGDGDRRTEELDWFMQIVSKSDSNDVERRRAVVTFRLEHRIKKWKIVGIDPLSFFDPPKAF